MPRREFPVSVKKAAFERAAGHCECGCGQPFTPGDGPEYHHRVEDALDGAPVLDNCMVVRRTCHRAVSITRAPFIAKAARLERKEHGITAPKRKLPGSKGSPWKAKIGRGWVRREED